MNPAEEQDALDAERRDRPDWADVSTYHAAQRSLRLVIKAWVPGVEIVPEVNGYSVRYEGTQVSCYVLHATGAFRWGWVAAHNGREDFTDLVAYLEFLSALTREAPIV